MIKKMDMEFLIVDSSITKDNGREEKNMETVISSIRRTDSHMLVSTTEAGKKEEEDCCFPMVACMLVNSIVINLMVKDICSLSTRTATEDHSTMGRGRERELTISVRDRCLKENGLGIVKFRVS